MVRRLPEDQQLGMVNDGWRYDGLWNDESGYDEGDDEPATANRKKFHKGEKLKIGGAQGLTLIVEGTEKGGEKRAG